MLHSCDHGGSKGIANVGDDTGQNTALLGSFPTVFREKRASTGLSVQDLLVYQLT
jgi:hypothetical protein